MKILMLRLESNDTVFTTEPPAAVAAEVVGDVEDAEIEFVDPEEADDGDDQEEGEAALNDDMLAAEQEAEKALAGLGFGDAMEMLKSTSDAVEEKPEQKMRDQRNHLSLTLARRVSRRANRAKQNRRVIRRNNPINQRQKRICPLRTLPKTHHLWQTTIRYKHSRMLGWTGDIDFPFDAFNASAETTSTDATNSEIPDVAMPGKQEEQPKQDFVPQEQNSCRAMTFQCSVVLMNRHHGRLSRSLC